jgi:hypothetical protein
MPYLNLEMSKPVRVEWDGQFPKYDKEAKYPKFEYLLKVNGELLTFAATDTTHDKIQKFCQMNGNEFALVKVPYTKYKSDGYVFNVEPYDITNSEQNAHMHGQTNTQYKKNQPAEGEKDWDKINAEKDDKILKGQARNQAVSLYQGKETLPDKYQLTFKARELYWMWKEMNWDKELPDEKPVETKQEEPPAPVDTDFIGDEDLPF